MAYKLLSPVLRENLDKDLDQIMLTEDEAFLAEA